MESEATAIDARIGLLKRRISELEKESRETGKDIKTAQRPNFRGDVNGGHVRQLRSHREQVRATIHQLKTELHEIETKGASGLDPADMTPEEWLQYHAEQAHRLQIPELEVYVREWAQKVGAMVVVEDGYAQLRYRNAG